jgi:heme exporter protein C
MAKENRWLYLLIGLAAVSMLLSILLVFAVAPEAVNLATETERLVQRIFYFHVPGWWVGFLAFLVAAVSGVGFLLSGNERWDEVELASVEIGLTFTTIGLVTGSLWARPTWNTWWTWEPRLTTAAVGWLLYVAYLTLRSGIDHRQRRYRLAAVYSIVAFVSVPVNFLAIRWWRTIHPAVIGVSSAEAVGGFTAGPTMQGVFFLCLLSFTLLYVVLVLVRVRGERLGRRMEELRHRVLQR